MYRLQKRHNAATILPLFHGYCPDMNAITEEKLVTILERILQGSAEALHIPSEEKEPARLTLKRMLAICEKNQS